jgi:hypothetical protein
MDTLATLEGISPTAEEIISDIYVTPAASGSLVRIPAATTPPLTRAGERDMG